VNKGRSIDCGTPEAPLSAWLDDDCTKDEGRSINCGTPEAPLSAWLDDDCTRDATSKTHSAPSLVPIQEIVRTCTTRPLMHRSDAHNNTHNTMRTHRHTHTHTR